MAKVKIQGNASGTGVLTVTAPNTSTDRTITLPDSTDTLAVNSDVTNKLPLAGGTMTGTLSLQNNVSNSTSATLKLTGSSNVTQDNFILFGDNATSSPIAMGFDNSENTFKIARNANDDLNSNIYFKMSSSGVISAPIGVELGGGLNATAANTLDDYEEGTFTATIGNATTSGGNNTGVYIRVGRLCHFQYYTGAMSFSNVGGTATISGLPFTMESLHTAYSVFAYVHGDAITNCAGFHGEVNGTTLFAVQNDSTAYRPWVAGTKYCMVGGTYIVKEGS